MDPTAEKIPIRKHSGSDTRFQIRYPNPDKNFLLGYFLLLYFDLYSTCCLQAHVKGSQGHQHGRHQKEDAEPQGIIVPIGQVPAVITQ